MHEDRCPLSGYEHAGLVSHWDLDGILSAVLLIRAATLLGISIGYRLSTHRRLLRSIKEILEDKGLLLIADLNPDVPTAKSISLLSSKVGGIVWFDHHEWPQEARRILSQLDNIVLFLDRGLISAEIVSRVLTDNCGLTDLVKEYSELLRIAKADDTNNLEESIEQEVVKWRIVLRKADWPLRYRILEALLEQPAWPSWLEGFYREVREDYQKALEEALSTLTIINSCGHKIAVVRASEELNPSDVYNSLHRRIDADVYVIVYDKGLSLRSETVDVARIASRLGGGGHNHAAGAPLTGLSLDQALSRISEALCTAE